MSTYIVGDIQGCLDPLYALLLQVDFKPKHDQLWFAGDLVNRGPKSLETLRFIKSLGDAAKVVLGNHDLHLLACWHGKREPGRKDTFEEILEATDADKLLHWLQQQPLIYRKRSMKTVLVHAGIPPIWSVNKACELANEVEEVLRGKKAGEYFSTMYGNMPKVWNDKLKGSERWRVITNYLTRMRFCGPNGELDLESKGEPACPPAGFKPWFQYARQPALNYTVYFGHWAALMGRTGTPNFIGLDTGCVWGGELSMLRLEDGELFCEDCSLSGPNKA